MYGPQIEKVMQVITLENQHRLNQAERYRQLAHAMGSEQQALRPQHNVLGDVVRRLSFRNRTAPANSAS
jgi:hypothetical protein